jgi:hypothetical protein
VTELKLGKQAARHDTRDLLFHDYRATVESIPIARIGYHHDIPAPIGMLGNDSYGDCVWAGAAHETMLWNATQARAVPFTDAAVLGDYGAVTGFDASDPSSDQGTVVHDALSYRRHTGIADAAGLRHKLGAYVSLEPGNWRELLEALEVFEAVGIGFAFPGYAMDQFNAGKPWSYRPGGIIEGGHYVPIVGRPHVATISCVTWGQLQPMTRAFFHAYADECWGLLSAEMLGADGLSAEGFNYAALQADVAALG